MKITFKEFQKQKALAEKLNQKFINGKLTEADRQKWLGIDIKIRQLVLKET